MSAREDIIRLQAIRDRPGYEARARAQIFSWANGKPYHEKINEECCPDFSCCYPDLFENDQTKRWEQYRQYVSDHKGSENV